MLFVYEQWTLWLIITRGRVLRCEINWRLIFVHLESVSRCPGAKRRCPYSLLSGVLAAKEETVSLLSTIPGVLVVSWCPKLWKHWIIATCTLAEEVSLLSALTLSQVPVWLAAAAASTNYGKSCPTSSLTNGATVFSAFFDLSLVWC